MRVTMTASGMELRRWHATRAMLRRHHDGRRPRGDSPPARHAAMRVTMTATGMELRRRQATRPSAGAPSRRTRLKR